MINKEIKKEIIDSLILRNHMLSEAEKNGIQIDEDKVKDSFNVFMQSTGLTEEQFKQKLDEAEKELLTAIEIDPASLDFLYALADHYIKSEQFTKARETAQEIKAKFPSAQIGDQLLQFLADK